MKRFFKFASYAVMMALFTVALSGCTKKTSTTDPRVNKVIVWSFEDPDVWKPIKTNFETTNKGFILEYVQQALNSSYENKVLNSQLSGTGPDVWSMPNDWVFRHKDKLIPAADSLKKSLGDLDDKFFKSIKQSVQIDDSIYALSPSGEPLMIYYNPTAVQQAVVDYKNNGADQVLKKNLDTIFNPMPKTWTDFATAVKFLTKKDGDKINFAGAALGTDDVSYSQDILYLLMLQNQTKLLSDDLKLATFSLPSSTPIGSEEVPGKRALEFYSSFADPKSPNYTWNDSMGDDIDAFVAGKVFMIFGYSRLDNTFAQKYPEFKNYRKFFVPQLEAQADKIVDYARFNAFGVSNTAPNTAVAWNLIYNLTSTYASDYNSASRVTGSTKIEQDVSIENRNNSYPERLELATAKSFKKGRYPADFDANIRNAIRAVNKGTIGAQAALDQAADNITQLLRKETW